MVMRKKKAVSGLRSQAPTTERDTLKYLLATGNIPVVVIVIVSNWYFG